MIKNFEQYISNRLKQPITKVSTISGGDISKAYRIKTQNNSYFLKSNHATNALTMFQTEANGLQLIAKTNTIKTPKVLVCDSFEGSAFLILEFITSKLPSDKDFKNLGFQLAKLHQCTSKTFGLYQDNFIGSLPQSNQQHKNWVDFYTKERLLPQLKLAQQKNLLSNYECPSQETIKSHLKPLLKNAKPSFLHGDLWGGNYLISKDGTPYLIDPATHYGHSEVDIAMSKLFGGFGESFYKAYYSQLPKNEHTQTLTEIYQLYYLLVHLNLFGNSYYGSVTSILAKHF